MKKILVIGASGSIGSGFVKHISCRNEVEVVATYNNSKVTFDNTITTNLDITDKSSFSNLDTDFNAVYLIAGAMPAAMKGYDSQKYIDTNITGTMNVLEFCRINDIKKLIYIMTFSDVSGSFYTGKPIQETDSRTLTYTGDHSVYAISKVTACELIEHYHQEHNLQTMIFRIPTVYCCDDNVDYYVDGVIKTKAYVKMIRDVVNGRELELWGNINNAKDMPYIKDFSVLLEKALYHETAQGLFNAGTGTPVSLKEFSEAVVEVFGEGREIDINLKPEKNSQPNFTFDMKKTNETFNYSPAYNIKTMLLDIKNNSPLNTF